MYITISVNDRNKSIFTAGMNKPPQLQIQERLIEIAKEIFTPDELAKLTFITRRNTGEFIGPDDLTKRLQEEFIKRSRNP